jgi:hypothetical protein
VTASPAARRNLSAPFLVYRASRCRHRWRGANEHRRHIGGNSGGPGRRSRCRRGGSIRRTRAALKDLHSGLYRRPTLAPRARRRPRQCASRGFSCVVLQSRPQPDSALERRGHACAVVLIKGRSPDQDRPSRIQWIAVMVRGGEARARTGGPRGGERSLRLAESFSHSSAPMHTPHTRDAPLSFSVLSLNLCVALWRAAHVARGWDVQGSGLTAAVACGLPRKTSSVYYLLLCNNEAQRESHLRHAPSRPVSSHRVLTGPLLPQTSSVAR